VPQRVPYTRIPGLTPEQQAQIDRDFQEAAAQLDAGVGQVQVPYRQIPGLDPETQRQIDRNFAELFCSGSTTNTDPAGTIITSDNFIRGTNPSPLGFTDIYAGGATLPWIADSGIWEQFGGQMILLTSTTGANASNYVLLNAQRPGATYKFSCQRPIGGGANGCMVRWTDASNYYGYIWYPNGAVYTREIFKYVAGARTVLASENLTGANVVAGQKEHTLTVSGSSLSSAALTYTGSGALTATDTALTTGDYVGALIQNPAASNYQDLVQVYAA